jgi:hypothetical protein
MKSGQQGEPMTRPVVILSLLTLVATPATGQSNSSTEPWRIREMTPPASQNYQPPAVDVGSSGRFGIGIFGLKPDTARGRAITVRDVNAPRQRRAGVGLSLKF